MESKFKLYNTIAREIVPFSSLEKGRVGIYWCGPTVYAPAHIGHARSGVVLDTLVRALRYLGYHVSTVRNITDVGHMRGDGDGGEDKIGRAARLAAVNPMEIAQRYSNAYRAMLRMLGTLAPEIEPCATGHITEQIALVERLISKGCAYEVNGSVYFDLPAFHAKHGYGSLSGRDIGALVTGTRTLTSVSEKRSVLDFALWKKATPDHLMRWPSPWGAGFPGWHVECTAMSAKYLGMPFDIHGGGLDLCFPHHECEIAQSKAAYGVMPARYWVHHNLVTLAGKKMSKSENHFITLEACCKGDHPLLSQAYSPMAVRFLLLQAHYRGPLDLSDHALQAAQKAYYKLINGRKIIEELVMPMQAGASKAGVMDKDIARICKACDDDLCHDLNTPKVIAHLFDLLKYIHQIAQGELAIDALLPTTWVQLKETYTTFLDQILGLKQEHSIEVKALLSLCMDAYVDAKARKDYARVDQIRATLLKQGIALQDRKEAVGWQYIGSKF